MAETQIEGLEGRYYNPQYHAAFTAGRDLCDTVDKHEVSKWLETQDSHNKHKMVRYRFPRRSYNVEEVDSVWEADLVDVRSISTHNNGFSYILVVIDVLSKFAWVQPLINKSGKSVTSAFRRILTAGEPHRIPRVLQTDRGKEFVNSEFQVLLQKYQINYRVVRNPDIKASIVERFNRTLKERIWRYFTYTHSKRYIDVLQKIVYAYNHHIHSGTRLRPCDVNEKNALVAVKNLAKRYNGCRGVSVKHKYNRGDHVRISTAKAAFAKGYETGWSSEIFKIKRVSTFRAPVVYILDDLKGEEIDGIFYEEELSRVHREG